MQRAFSSILGAGLCAGTVAMGDVPRVATDIAPVHSLAAQVMHGLGEPDLIVRPGASPHEYSLRPSEAAALSNADVVFWIGEDLTPWLGRSIEKLAQDSAIVSLLEANETVRLPYREGPVFGADEAHEDEHEEHDDHDDHAEAGHDDHDQDNHDDHDGHDHDGDDVHAWLDPVNGKYWLEIIAAELSRLDPDNSAQYLENAALGKARIDSVVAEITAELAGAEQQRFVVLHDAYQYFETRFGMSEVGSIALSDASDPGPARVKEIQKTVRDLKVTCVFSEPQFNAAIVATVLEDSAAKSATLDPLGVGIETGGTFYPELLRSISSSIAGCR